MLAVELIIARAVNIGASILLAGIFTFDLAMLGRSSRAGSGDLDEIECRLFHLAVWSLIAALLSALLWFCLEVASMSGLPVTRAFSTIAWQTVLFETQFGRVWQLRLGLIAAAFAFVALGLAQVKARRGLMPVLWLLSVILLVSLVPVLRRFSTFSLCCVSVLVVSGISNSWLLVGSIHALFTTPYGRLLLFKLTLFAMLVAFGARNRFLIKERLLKTPADPDLLPQLRRNVLCEVGLGAAVVTIVACLGVTPPARTALVSQFDRTIPVSAK